MNHGIPGLVFGIASPTKKLISWNIFVLRAYFSISTLCCIFFFRTFQKRIERIHGAVVDGDIDVLEALLKRRNLAISKDDNGHGILHKAVFHGHREIVEWLCDKYPETMELKDWVST